MSNDRPACLFTRWLSVIAGIAAVVGVVLGLGGGVRAAGMPSAPGAFDGGMPAQVTPYDR